MRSDLPQNFDQSGPLNLKQKHQRRFAPVGGRIAQEQVDQFPQEWVPQFRRNTHTCNGQK
jgi:hypothetical protein